MRQDYPNNSWIEAEHIELGRDFKLGADVHIRVRGLFKVGDFGRFGDNVTINAERVRFGSHFYHYTAGLRIGGGGSQFPDAELTVGDRCVMHNNYINLARAVWIGNDVGLSPDVDILTHGFWDSVLKGYPTNYAPVTIGDGVIVGQRSMILAGCTIAPNIVVGAGSVVTKDLKAPRCVYAGSPARWQKALVEPNRNEKIRIMAGILERYSMLSGAQVEFEYPNIRIEDAVIDVIALTITGTETLTTDKLRDHLRRSGIRIYTERPFVSL